VESPRGVSAPGVPTMQTQMPSGGSIEMMLAQIKQKAAEERKEMEAKHRKTTEQVEQLQVELQQSQWEVDQLSADKQALHSQYLGRIEEIQTKQKTTYVDNEKLKRENEKLSIKIDVIIAQKEGLEKEKREVLEQEGGIAKKMTWLEERLEEERGNSASLSDHLKVARREGRESAQQALDLQVQYDILKGENKRLHVDLEGARTNADKLEMHVGHLTSQMKLSEAIAAEHDELITKFHENQNKLRTAESELKANLAREQTLVAHVEAATQERVVYRIMLRSLFDKRNKIKAQCEAMEQRMQGFQDELIAAQNSGGGLSGASVDDVKNEREYLLELENENEGLKADLQISKDECGHLHDELEETREVCDGLKTDKAKVLGQCDVLRGKVAAAKKLEEILKGMDSFIQLKDMGDSLATNLNQFLMAGASTE
jgi:chromosome segregation ATPase